MSTESILRNNFDPEAFSQLVESVAARSDDHLSNARFRSKHLDKSEKLVLLPAVTADRFLTRLNRAKCDVFNGQLNQRDSWLPALLYWNKLRSTFWNTFSESWRFEDVILENGLVVGGEKNEIIFLGQRVRGASGSWPRCKGKHAQAHSRLRDFLEGSHYSVSHSLPF